MQTNQVADGLAVSDPRIRPSRPVADPGALPPDPAARLHAEAIRAVSAGELVPGVLEDAERAQAGRDPAGKAVPGLATGLSSLDALLGGMGPCLHVLEGRPGAGKTALAMQTAASAARDAPVLYVTFENAPADLALRALSARARVSLLDLRAGAGDLEAVRRAAAEWSEASGRVHFLEGSSRLTVGRVRHEAEEAMRRHGARRCLVVVDSLTTWAVQWAEAGESRGHRERAEALGVALGDVAASLASPVLALASHDMAQVATDKSTRISVPDSVEVTGTLAAAAAVVMVLTDSRTRGEKPPARAVDLTVAKNRYGPLGRLEMVFRPEFASLRELLSQRS